MSTAKLPPEEYIGIIREFLQSGKINLDIMARLPETPEISSDFLKENPGLIIDLLLDLLNTRIVESKENEPFLRYVYTMCKKIVETKSKFDINLLAQKTAAFLQNPGTEANFLDDILRLLIDDRTEGKLEFISLLPENQIVIKKLFDLYTTIKHSNWFNPRLDNVKYHLLEIPVKTLEGAALWMDQVVLNMPRNQSLFNISKFLPDNAPKWLTKDLSITQAFLALHHLHDKPNDMDVLDRVFIGNNIPISFPEDAVEKLSLSGLDTGITLLMKGDYSSFQKFITLSLDSSGDSDPLDKLNKELGALLPYVTYNGEPIINTMIESPLYNTRPYDKAILCFLTNTICSTLDNTKFVITNLGKFNLQILKKIFYSHFNTKLIDAVIEYLYSNKKDCELDTYKYMYKAIIEKAISYFSENSSFLYKITFLLGDKENTIKEFISKEKLSNPENLAIDALKIVREHRKSALGGQKDASTQVSEKDLLPTEETRAKAEPLTDPLKAKLEEIITRCTNSHNFIDKGRESLHHIWKNIKGDLRRSFDTRKALYDLFVEKLAEEQTLQGPYHKAWDILSDVMICGSGNRWPNLMKLYYAHSAQQSIAPEDNLEKLDEGAAALMGLFIDPNVF
jgi:hypothetical protein